MSKRHLSSRERFVLWNYVQTEYTGSGLNDPEFAKQAAEKLAFVVHANHVYEARKGLDIPSNYSVVKEMSPAALVARVQALEAALQGLYRHLGWTPGKETDRG